MPILTYVVDLYLGVTQENPDPGSVIFSNYAGQEAVVSWRQRHQDEAAICGPDLRQVFAHGYRPIGEFTFGKRKKPNPYR